MYQVIAPQTKAEFKRYYHFRWQYLRAPWQQGQGSEQDELENQSMHRMVVDGQGEILAVGRLHKTSQHTGQIRYMAVADNQQGKGLGRLIVDALESQAIKEGVDEIALNARELALPFYLALGYQQVEKTHLLYDEIQHYLMLKALPKLAEHKSVLANKLTNTWHSTIPMSQAMNMTVSYFDGKQLLTNCDLAFNKNLHNTMFAGSIYTLATLTGWGWVYFMLAAAGLEGDIVLADANIKYLSPVAGAGCGSVTADDVEGSIERISQGRRAKVTLKVQVKCGDLVAAVFEGKYAVLPVSEKS